MFEEKKTFTQIKELGEFKLIEHLTQNTKIKNKSTIKGIGDDAAVIKSNNETVITTDTLTNGIHFDLTYTPLKHLGYKSVVVNLSDIYAMNATPKQILVSISVSNKFSIEMLEDFYSGIQKACEVYNVDLIGGDTTPSTGGLTITITAIGEATKDKLTYRSGAKPNNLIVVSGNLGSAYMGLQLLEREKEVFNNNDKVQPDFSGKEYLLERILKPEARKDIIELLDEKGITPTAMIDISDGLSSELLHLCKNSDMGCKIYEEKLPIDPQTMMMADEFNIPVGIPALNGGEDYELLLTIDMNDYEKIKDEQKLRVIGHITDKNEGKYIITPDNKAVELQAQGWNPLKTSDSFSKN